MKLDDLQRLIDRRVIGPAEVVRLSYYVVKERIDGIKVQGTVGFGQCLSVVSLHDEQVAIPLVRSGLIGTQLNGAPQFFFGGGEVPVVTHGHIAENGMSFREPGIELQGFLCGLARFWFAVTRRHSVVGYLAQNRRRRSQSSIGFRIGRIVVNGLIKESNEASQVSAAAPGEFALLVSVAGFSNLGRGRVNGPGR